ncbi:hypothetical protein Tco_0573399 [Tanacetum coccineum]
MDMPKCCGQRAPAAVKGVKVLSSDLLWEVVWTFVEDCGSWMCGRAIDIMQLTRASGKKMMTTKYQNPGSIQAGAFKIGETAGTIDNITQCKLYRPGSVGFVSKYEMTICLAKLQGGMSNELYNTIPRVTDGIYEDLDVAIPIHALMSRLIWFLADDIKDQLKF